MTELRMIDVEKIDDVGKLQNVHPDQAVALSELIREAGLLQAIRVRETDDGFRLIFGAKRLAAVKLLGATEIRAEVVAPDAADETQEAIEAIVEQFGQLGMTVLERAQKLVAWKDLYESQHATAGRGGKRPTSFNKVQTANFAVCFSAAAADVLGISERSVRVAVQIARGIQPEIQEVLRHHSVANRQSELQLLCAQTPARQSHIAGVLFSEPVQAHSVTDAIALLDRVQTPRALTVPEKFCQRFQVLKPNEQERFFELNSDAIERWMAKRSTTSAKLRSVA